MRFTRILLVVACSFFTATVFAQSGGQFAVKSSVTGAGSGTASAGGQFAVRSTVGQPLAGNAIASPYTVSSGFWTRFTVAHKAFDFDGDGKTDIGVLHPSGGVAEWWINRSSDGSTFALQ